MKKRSQENSWGLFSSLPVEITAERNLDGNQMDVNVLSSVYEKNIEKLLTEAVAQENTGDIGIFYAKKEATALTPAGVQFPIRIQDTIASTPIIHRFSEKVNMQISDVTQSQQFKRWFGDWQNHPEDASKVVNDDGTLKVVYHGTNADFTVFESDNGTYWFSESEDYAEAMAEERGGDGKVMSVYLDMKNPYYAKLEPGKFTDPTYEAPIIRAAKEGGHDGIIIENDTDSDIESETFYVVFSPTQIKSATDNIGTFDRNNPDIRYQKRGGMDALTPKDMLSRSRRRHLRQTWHLGIKTAGTRVNPLLLTRQVMFCKLSERWKKTYICLATRSTRYLKRTPKCPWRK